MQPESYQLFVYGSLRRGFHHSAYQYISNYFRCVGPATVKGRLYDMGDYPAAVPTHEDAYIVGELYELNNKDEFGWAFGQIDDYEGINPEIGEIPLYRRSITNVFCNGLNSMAWIYWYNGDVSGHPVIESGDVLEYIKEKKNN
jgi:gamma-glutamylcyclotransferase (GGCT)/AIG2-like uncharacterized protein YtfP